jgi:dUTPase
MPVPKVEVMEVVELSTPEERGEGGFGSTGRTKVIAKV